MRGRKNGVRRLRQPSRLQRTELEVALETSLASAADEEQDNQLVERLVEMGYNEEQAVGCMAYLEEKSVESAIDFIESQHTEDVDDGDDDSSGGDTDSGGTRWEDFGGGQLGSTPVSGNNESGASDDNVGQFEADLAAALSASLAEATLNSTATSLPPPLPPPPPPPPSAGAASTETTVDSIVVPSSTRHAMPVVLHESPAMPTAQIDTMPPPSYEDSVNTAFHAEAMYIGPITEVGSENSDLV